MVTNTLAPIGTTPNHSLEASRPSSPTSVDRSHCRPPRHRKQEEGLTKCLLVGLRHDYFLHTVGMLQRLTLRSWSYTHHRQPPACRSARPNRANSGRQVGRGRRMPSEATGQRTGELLVAHRGSPTPEVLHQTLLECELVAVPGKRVFEIPPRLLQKPGVGRCPACKVPQYLLAQRFTSSTSAMAM